MILFDYSYHADIDGNMFAIHENENWQGGLPVTIYMNGINILTTKRDSYKAKADSGEEIYIKEVKEYADVVVESVETGNLYLTQRRFLRDGNERSKRDYGYYQRWY